MSDSQKKGNFWASLPGILTALLGSGGLIASIQIFQNPSQSSPPPSPGTSSHSIKTEHFEVYADSIKGYKYTNNKNEHVQIEFNAQGQWLAIPENLNNSRILDNTKGYLSPKGAPNFESNRKTLCRAPVGALIILGEDKECKAYGEKGTFDLKPQETVYFLMNDVIGLYEDNKGSIKVNLSVAKS